MPDPLQIHASATLPNHHAITHDLKHALERFTRLRRRCCLQRDRVFRQRRDEIEAILGAFEWRWQTRATRAWTTNGLRVVAWNIERGKRFEALCHVFDREAALNSADLLLLTEVDLGMGRSGNRNVARALAQRLEMDYLFVNHHLVLSRGDLGEQGHTTPNTLAMHGSALLTRWPVTRFTSVALPEYVDKFHAFEKRLGCKRALLASIALPSGLLTVAVVHLDPFCPPRHRAWQMRRILRAAERFSPDAPVLIGGDWNTNTYDLSGGLVLLRDLALRLTRHDMADIITHHLAPDVRYERDLFQDMARAGFEVAGFNDRARGTLRYDAFDPEVVEKSLAYMPRMLWERLQRKLSPWGGVVPLRLDWFAGRRLRAPDDASVLEGPSWRGQQASDHDPIVATWVGLAPFNELSDTLTTRGLSHPGQGW